MSSLCPKPHPPSDAFKGKRIIALDSEGVDLSREGSLRQLGTEDSTFIVDVLNKKKNDPLSLWLKELLEDHNVVKVIHDCRMDSDALWHHLDIKLTNVHDTSCWHEAITGNKGVGLNGVLGYCGLPAALQRDKSIYDFEPNFWDKRPMTEKMIDWASGDIASILKVRDVQMSKALPSSKERQQAERASESFPSTRDIKVATVCVVSHVGLFIGKGGATIRALQRRTSTIIVKRGQSSSGNFIVFYNNETDLSSVKQAAREL